MNDVVLAQKHLMAQSSKIQGDSAKFREDSALLQAQADGESRMQKLESLAEESRTSKVSAAELRQCK